MVFESQVTETLPADFVSAIQKAIEDSSYAGMLMGYRLLGVKVFLLKAEYQGENEEGIKAALKTAAVQAFRKALTKSKSCLLEPIFDLEVVTPDEFLGDVMSDLNARRAKVEEVRLENHLQVIKAQAPLAPLFGYATELRSLSQGRCFFFHGDAGVRSCAGKNIEANSRWRWDINPSYLINNSFFHKECNLYISKRKKGNYIPILDIVVLLMIYRY